MALLTRYAPHLPLWIRHSARARGPRGGLLVPHGDCHPRQDDWQGVTLLGRFLASTANSASPVVSTYSGVATRADGLSTAKKNLLLQRSARAQPRLFGTLKDYYKKGKGVPVHGTVTLYMARNMLQHALEANTRDKSQALQALAALKAFANDQKYYGDKKLLSAAVSPLALLGGKHGGGSSLDLYDDVVKESLAVTCLLLEKAPVLCSEISEDKGVKTSLERIRDRGSGSEMGKLANEILAKLSTTPN